MKKFINLSGILAVLLCGAAIGVMSMSPPEYDVARGAAIAAGIMAVLAFFLWFLQTREPITVQLVIGLMTIVVPVGGVVLGVNWIDNIQLRNLREAPPKDAGLLHSEVKALFSTNPNIMANRTIHIGDSKGGLIYGGPPGTPAFSMFGAELTVELIDGEAKITTDIKDRDGKLIARLYRNEWQVAPPPQTCDRNYTKDRLEVIDPRGVVLQVRVLSDNAQLQGEWWGGPHQAIRLGAVAQIQLNQADTSQRLRHKASRMAPRITRNRQDICLSKRSPFGRNAMTDIIFSTG
jgi:hypothetical protein